MRNNLIFNISGGRCCNLSTNLKLHTLKKSDNIYVVYLDNAKAFLKMTQNVSINKLYSLGLDDKFSILLTSYLNDRSKHVSVYTQVSIPLDVLNGVRQGSILGLLLFHFFFKDLRSILLVAFASVFHGDLKLFCNKPNFLEALTKLHNWTT